jgi:ComF family protein
LKSSVLLRSLLVSARRTARLALDLAFPPCCTFCGLDLHAASPQSGLCDACHASFCSLPGPLCPRCATPSTQSTHPSQNFQNSHSSRESEEVDEACQVASSRHAEFATTQPAKPKRATPLHHGCARCHTRNYYFESATALGVYQGALRLAVRRMKRPAFEPLTYAVGNLLSERVADWTSGAPVDLVVPVPMHWTRRMLRGANTAEVLADAVARGLGVESRSRLVICGRVTKKQGLLAPAERFANVRQAFRMAKNGAKNSAVAGARILVVDDVMTTGATASEVARVLRRAQAASVRVAVVGRGVGRS